MEASANPEVDPRPNTVKWLEAARSANEARKVDISTLAITGKFLASLITGEEFAAELITAGYTDNDIIAWAKGLYHGD